MSYQLDAFSVTQPVKALEKTQSTSKLEEASTHKSAKTHTSNVVVTCDLDLLPPDPKMNDFPGLIVETFYVKFDDHSSIGF